MVMTATPTVRKSEDFLHVIYHLVQAAVSVVRNLDVVHYSGAAIALHIWRFQLVYVVVSVIG